mmetsp:Transcript_8792/g.21464  ORF Transcript_8792/g.21464 Transcript_8792/m.21464 type:complete len:160 (-) Transcript_8792:4379-4858(-)
MTRSGVFLLAWSLILTIGLQLGRTHAFSRDLQRNSLAKAPVPSSKTTMMFSTPPERDDFNAFADPLSSNKPPISASEPEGTSYPIDLPSPILLASSMVLAIVGVGSGFDIFSDAPRLPFIVNAIISASGLSLCLGLFYASILKAQAETEEDDKRYMNGR